MKAIIRLAVLSAIVLAPATLSAQTGSSAIPGKGNWMLELNMRPFSDQEIFSIDKLQTKYWLGDKIVLRLGVEYSFKENVINENDYSSETLYPDTMYERTDLYGIHAGFEYRFLRNSKISPYVGLEFSYRQKSTTSTYTIHDVYYNGELYEISVRDLTGGWLGYEYSGNYTMSTYDKERAFSSFTGGLIIGADIFVVKNLYFGFEIGVAYRDIKYSPVELDMTTHYVRDGSVENTKTTKTPAQHSSQLTFAANSAIRLGIWF